MLILCLRRKFYWASFSKISSNTKKCSRITFQYFYGKRIPFRIGTLVEMAKDMLTKVGRTILPNIFYSFM